MRGTEKQIAWAEEIRGRVISILKSGLTIDGLPQEGKDAISSWLEAMDNAEYAGDVIDNFRGVKQTGDAVKDLVAVRDVYLSQTKYINSPSEAKLLCREVKK